MTKNIIEPVDTKVLIEKANKYGTIEVPTNGNPIVDTMLETMKGSGKILSIKQISNLFRDEDGNELPNKYWADKCWNLAGGKNFKSRENKSVLLHVSTRGHYQYNPDFLS